MNEADLCIGRMVRGGGLFITVATVTETYSDQGEGCKY